MCKSQRSLGTHAAVASLGENHTGSHFVAGMRPPNRERDARQPEAHFGWGRGHRPPTQRLWKSAFCFRWCLCERPKPTLLHPALS